MRKLRSLAITPLAALTAAIACCISYQTAAADTPEGRRIDPRMEAAMRRDLGIGPEQVQRYLRAAEAAPGKVDQARQRLGNRFAGSWLENDGRGGLKQVVATTGSTVAVNLAGVEVRRARFSHLELELTAQALDVSSKARTRAPKATGVDAWYVDPASNRVVVKVTPGATLAVADFVAASSADIDAIRFEISEGRPMTSAAAIGGNAYTIPSLGNRRCSIGFAARSSGSLERVGFVTAGHCHQSTQPASANILDSVFGGTIGYRLVNIGGASVGYFSNAKFPGSDIAYVRLTSGHQAIGRVNRYNGTTVPVKGHVARNAYVVGTPVCRSGLASGWRCGKITASKVTVNYAEGTVYDLVQADACNTQGDSGGPWLIGDRAAGVHSGGQLLTGTAPLSNCSVANPVSYFQSTAPYFVTITNGTIQFGPWNLIVSN